RFWIRRRSIRRRFWRGLSRKTIPRIDTIKTDRDIGLSGNRVIGKSPESPTSENPGFNRKGREGRKGIGSSPQTALRSQRQGCQPKRIKLIGARLYRNRKDPCYPCCEW